MRNNRRLRAGFAIVPLALLYSCSNGRKTETQAADFSLQAASRNCDSSGINGRWQLVGIHAAEKMSRPDTATELRISHCSKIDHYVGATLAGSKTFKLYKVVQYCDDYQFAFSNDSICCANFRGHDTLVLGECNDHEAAKCYFRRL